MGLLKRKKNTPPPLPEVTKLQRMPTEDVYLMLEASLMEAQHNLSQFRSTPEDQRGALLAWLQSSSETITLGCKELSQRI